MATGGCVADIETVELADRECPPVFLKQLGRGLWRTAGKDVPTVLDFVGRQRKEFCFDLRFRTSVA